MISTGKIKNRVDNKLVILSFLLILGFFTWLIINSGRESFFIQRSTLETFTTVFISIILEAIPFVMLGVFISSIIQIYVTEDMITRIIPKNLFVGLIVASFMGLIFPICECANVPITRRLVKKGVPLHIGITFMMSVAIMNPVVLLSTYYAFSGSIKIVILRGSLGVIGAIIIGYIVSLIQNPKTALKDLKESQELSCCSHHHSHAHDEVSNHENHHNHSHNEGCNHEDHHHHSHNEGCNHGDHHNELQSDLHQAAVTCCSQPHEEEDHHHEGCGCGQDSSLHKGKISIKGKINEIIEHTSIELFSVGRFLILGAFISAIMQTIVPRSSLTAVGQGNIISIIVMMSLAFLLSLCSEADAFIARTFIGQFTTGSIFSFIIYGPMIDIKNTLMLLEGFRWRFVIKLIGITTLVCFSFALIINWIGL